MLLPDSRNGFITRNAKTVEIIDEIPKTLNKIVDKYKHQIVSSKSFIRTSYLKKIDPTIMPLKAKIIEDFELVVEI